MESKTKIIISTILLILGITITIINNSQPAENIENNNQILTSKNPTHNLNSISLNEWKNLYDNDKSYQIIDVRTQKEYDNQKIPNSKLIDFYNKNFKQELNKLDKNKKYLIHCRSGSRSSKTLQIMKELKFTNVQNLIGGINAWNSAGYITN